MLPDIVYGQINDNGHLIYFSEENSGFNDIGLSSKELKYLKKQFDNNHPIVEINRFEYLLVCVKSDLKDDVNSSIEACRGKGNEVVGILQKNKINEVALKYLGKQESLFLSFLEGMILGSYRFEKYKSEKSDASILKSIQLDTALTSKDQIQHIVHLAQGVFKARDLINEPVSYLTAPKLAEEIKAMAKDASLSVEIFEKKKIESLRMGGLLAVNKGSVDPPTFTILEWKPENAVNDKPVVLIGKGLVYDTGGLSLKPTMNSMDEMKCDMSGSAAVAGAMYAIAKNKLPVHVVALIPSTDNRPGGNAYTPGDVITMHNGSTVEVLNTDAEGRLILADAISYASHYNPQLIVTIATLTGSAQMAIGQNALVGMGNAERKTIDAMVDSGSEVHERVVEFPFWDEYADELKSDIADLKNIGGRMAGAITAGKFLEKFASYPFIHLDIAGPAFLKKEISYRPKGGTGIGVRLLYQFINNLAN